LRPDVLLSRDHRGTFALVFFSLQFGLPGMLFHGTLAEIARCLKLEGKLNDTVELILLVTNKYNNSVIEVIEADLGTTVLIKGRLVHKDNLR